MKNKWIFLVILIGLFMYGAISSTPVFASSSSISSSAANKQITAATTYVAKSENIVKAPNFIVKTSQLSVYAAKDVVKKIISYGTTYKVKYNSLMIRLAKVQIKNNERARIVAAEKQISLATTYVIKSEEIVKVSGFIVKTSQLSVYAAKDVVNKINSYGNIYKASYNSLIKRLAIVQIKINERAIEVSKEVVNATSVSLNKSTDSIIVGMSGTLSAVVTPLNTTNKAIMWTSSNSEIVKVDITGRISAITTGSAIIKAATRDGKISATCIVIVTQWTPKPIPPASKSLIFAIDIGHNAAHDSGAVGIRTEDASTKEVGTLVMSKLTALGYTAIDCSPTNASSTKNALKQRVDIGNAAHANYYMSIHFNKFNGLASGSEVFISSSKIKTKAQKVLSNLVRLGYVNRGLKDNSRGLYVLNHTKMPAMLVECSFLDSASDMARYNADEIADALVNGLISGI